MRGISVCLIALPLLAGSAAQAHTREEIALENYRRVMNGELNLSDLPPQAQADILEIDRRARAEQVEDKRSPEQRCYAEELEKLASPPSYLARRSAALKCGIPYEEAEAGRAQ